MECMFTIDIQDVFIKKWQAEKSEDYNNLHNYIQDNFYVYEIAGKKQLVAKIPELLSRLNKSQKASHYYKKLVPYYDIAELIFVDGISLYFDDIEEFSADKAEIYKGYYKNLLELILKSIS